MAASFLYALELIFDSDGDPNRYINAVDTKTFTKESKAHAAALEWIKRCNDSRGIAIQVTEIPLFIADAEGSYYYVSHLPPENEREQVYIVQARQKPSVIKGTVIGPVVLGQYYEEGVINEC
jgi:hypothetical protein